MLRADGVSYRYGQQKLFDNLSLQILDHRITTLIGPNGSGKSSLFKLFTRTLKPEQGTIQLDHKNIWQLSAKEYAQKVAIVHQQNLLYDEMTVEELMKMGRLPYRSVFDSEKKTISKRSSKFYII